MQELLGRLVALDPHASESLRVVSFFDALIESHATLEAFLRGAAILSDCACGFATDAVSMRVGANGQRTAAPAVPSAATGWPTHGVSGTGLAWLEREGAAHENDAMVLERLVIGLAVTLDRSDPTLVERTALEILLDSEASIDRRAAAAIRLKLDVRGRVRIIAEPAARSTSVGTDARARTLIATPAGEVTVRLRAEDEARPGRAGIGVAVPPLELADSSRTAVLALRSTSAFRPVMDADELGSLLPLLALADSLGAVPDVAALERLLRNDRHALATLEALAASESIRAAAVIVGVHHSTMQARAIELAAELGFDPRTPSGRTRLVASLYLACVRANRFD